MSATGATQEQAGHQPVFLRNTSGLVKSATGLDAFIFNVSVMSIGMGLLSVHLVVPAFNPGANIPLSWLIATVVLVPIALAYYYWSVTLPRTGGNYIYLSRSMPLSIAVVLNFIELYTLLFFLAFAASFVAPVISGLLWYLGAHAGNDGLQQLATDLTSKGWIFVLGVLGCAVALAVQLRGTASFFRLQRVLFVVAMVTTLIMLIALLLGSKEDFARNFSSLTGVSMAEVAKTATDGGFATADFDLWATIKAIIWPVITMWAFFFSISFGGEIKAVKKGQFLGIVGSCVAFGVLACLASAVVNSKIGVGEQGALVWNSLLGTGPSTPTSPNTPTLAMIAVNSPVVAVLTGFGFFLWVFFWLTNIASYCGRAFFAHSIDRLAPSAVGHVTPKRRVPLGALLTAYAVALVFFALFVFTDFFAALAISMPLFFAFIGSLITGAMLFKTRPTLWQRSPAAAYRLGKVPVMTIACVIGVVVLVGVEILVYNDPSSLAKTRNSWIAIGAIVAVAIVAYLVASRLRRREGVELSQLTREIPVE